MTDDQDRKAPLSEKLCRFLSHVADLTDTVYFCADGYPKPDIHAQASIFLRLIKEGRITITDGVTAAPAPRVLLEDEVAAIKHGATRSDAAFALNVIRKFCEVNGLTLAAGVSATEPIFRRGVFELAAVIESLRDTGRFADEEGEVTDALDDLLRQLTDGVGAAPARHHIEQALAAVQRMWDTPKEQQNTAIQLGEVAGHLRAALGVNASEAPSNVKVLREALTVMLEGAECEDYGEAGIDNPIPVTHLPGKKCPVCMGRAALAATAGVKAAPAPEVTDAMVDAYLQANDAYWKRTDELPTPPDKWRTGTPREATRESLRAALGVIASGGVEVDRDSDGELLIDWSPGKGRMVSMTLRADGRLSYAFTWDGEQAHGTAQMPPALGVPVVVAVNPAIDRGPCTVCGVPWAKHGTAPTCASHDYAPAGTAGVEAVAATGPVRSDCWHPEVGRCDCKAECKLRKLTPGVSASDDETKGG